MPVDELGVEGVGDVGQQQRDRLRRARDEAAGDGVGPVAELLDRGVDRDALGLGHLAGAVERARDRRRGDPGETRDVVDRRPPAPGAGGAHAARVALAAPGCKRFQEALARRCRRAAARRSCRRTTARTARASSRAAPTSSCHRSGWLSVHRMSVARVDVEAGLRARPWRRAPARSRAGCRRSRTGSGSRAPSMSASSGAACRITSSSAAIRSLTDARVARVERGAGARGRAPRAPRGTTRAASTGTSSSSPRSSRCQSARSTPLLVSKAT